MPKFRKKPVVIEAQQFGGSNFGPLFEFCPTAKWELDPDTNLPILLIPTREGEMIASLNDWIIKGVQGEFYPCKPDIFKATYERVEE